MSIRRAAVDVAEALDLDRDLWNDLRTGGDTPLADRDAPLTSVERERFRAALYNTRIDESPESLGQLLRRLHLLVGYERPTTPGEPPTLVIRVRIVGGTVLEHFTEKPTPATPLARPKRTRGRASKQGIARTLRDIRAFVRARLLNEAASAPRTTILLLVVCGFGPRLFPTSRTMTASDFIRRATLRFDKLIRNRRQKKP